MKRIKIGKKDKNGIDIYEGDIVEWTSFDGETGEENTLIGIIEWDKGGTCFDVVNQYMLNINPEYTKVIGNIYKNPELTLKW